MIGLSGTPEPGQPPAPDSLYTGKIGCGGIDLAEEEEEVLFSGKMACTTNFAAQKRSQPGKWNWSECSSSPPRPEPAPCLVPRYARGDLYVDVVPPTRLHGFDYGSAVSCLAPYMASAAETAAEAAAETAAETTAETTEETAAYGFASMQSHLLPFLALFVGMLPEDGVDLGGVATNDECLDSGPSRRTPRRVSSIAAAARSADYYSQLDMEADDSPWRSTCSRRKGATKAVQSRAKRPPPTAAKVDSGVPASVEAVSTKVDSSVSAPAESISDKVDSSVSAPVEAMSAKDMRDYADRVYAKAVKSGMSIQGLLNQEKVVVVVTGADDCSPSLEQLTAEPFVPIVICSPGTGPSHSIVDHRRPPGSTKPRNPTQGYHDYAIEEYPVPLDPDKFLAAQRSKFDKWCQGLDGIASVDLKLFAPEITCQSNPVYSAPLCRSCLVRQVDCPCRFQGIRYFVELT
ncbi:hypothetical protein H4R26_004747, partial [Coemansia thaxteri]